MTKSKSGMVTRDASLFLAIAKFSVEVGKNTFLLLHLYGYLFSVAHGNRYLSRGSKENVLSLQLLGKYLSVDR